MASNSYAQTTSTERLEAYLNYLLEQQVIGDAELFAISSNAEQKQFIKTFFQAMEVTFKAIRLVGWFLV